MTWVSWCIVILPLTAIIAFAFFASRYVRGVVDYLVAGRVAGRYVISVGDLSAAIGVITLVAIVEEQYQCGMALSFWSGLLIPLSMLISLTGYCTYRFRETRALSLGQFLEIRYSRRFRIFAAGLRTLSEMLCNAIGPAVAARFFIYFLGFPHEINLFGIAIPTFAFVMGIVIVLALAIIWPGGQVSLMVTDCLQGLMSYPIFVIFTVYLLTKFSFVNEIAPVMMDRASGESFLNPMDLAELRDFNLFALVVTIFSSVLNRASWIGNDSSASGRTPHEQKMAGILGTWRSGFSWLMCVIIAMAVITFMNHARFAEPAHETRIALLEKVVNEAVGDDGKRDLLKTNLIEIPVQKHIIGIDPPLSRKSNLDTVYLDNIHDSLGHDASGNAQFQKVRTLYNQMMLPMMLRQMFPPFLMGLFCLLMVMLMLTTDDGRIFNASSTIIQDVVMPLRKQPLTKEQHFRYLRLCTLGVCLFFFFVSLFMSQLDYINMFSTIMTSIWLGGAGPIMIFGLYSRFGTTAGAWASLAFGSGISIGGIILQRNWANLFYPWLDRLGWVDGFDWFLQTISEPFNPYIVWVMDPVKFPVNSKEIYFLAMVSGLSAYIIISKLTCKKPFNLDRMLHRGKYSIDSEHPAPSLKSVWSWKNIYAKLIGITPEYTTGDKIITWSVLGYSLGVQFFLAFIAVLIWNAVSPFPKEYWIWYFFIKTIILGLVIGSISTVWFMIGGFIDIRRLFRDLAARVDNPLDDGRVEDNMSLADKIVMKEKENK